MKQKQAGIPRWAMILIAVLLATAVTLVVLYRVALGELRTGVQKALGPHSEVSEINLTWRAVEIVDVKIRAPAGWPVKDALDAQKITVTPDFTSLFSDTFRISRIKIERATLAVLRTANGKISVLPSLMARAGVVPGATDAARTSDTRIAIHHVEFVDSRLAFYDAAVASPPLAIMLDAVSGKIANIKLPALNGMSELSLTANIRGPAHAGTLKISGKMEFATKDSDLVVAVRGVDVVALEPYLIKTAETGVKQGSIDLDLTAKIAARRISARGKLTLRNLELKENDSASASFMGVPRNAFVDMLRRHDGTIDVPFAIQGGLDDPAFSLHSAFKARLGIAAAAALGISVKGLIGELGGLTDKESINEKIHESIGKLRRLLGK